MREMRRAECVCVCERERERERKRKKEELCLCNRERKKLWCQNFNKLAHPSTPATGNIYLNLNRIYFYCQLKRRQTWSGIRSMSRETDVNWSMYVMGAYSKKLFFFIIKASWLFLQFSCFACVELDRYFQVWSNPNQSNRRSAVQYYFPFKVSECSLPWVTQ